jgi:hypothetical protein
MHALTTPTGGGGMQDIVQTLGLVIAAVTIVNTVSAALIWPALLHRLDQRYSQSSAVDEKISARHGEVIRDLAHISSDLDEVGGKVNKIKEQKQVNYELAQRALTIAQAAEREVARQWENISDNVIKRLETIQHEFHATAIRIERHTMQLEGHAKEVEGLRSELREARRIIRKTEG